MPERVQLRRTKGWRKPEGVISVARPGRWGNPFHVSQWGLDLSLVLFANSVRGIFDPGVIDASEPDETFGDAAFQHRNWHRKLGGHPLELVGPELRGHDLACWCRLDQPCHADILLELANSPRTI